MALKALVKRYLDSWMRLYDPNVTQRKHINAVLESAADTFQRFGLTERYGVLSSKAKATLQLAYAGARCVKFYEGEGYGLGVYEVQSPIEPSKTTDYNVVFIRTLDFQSPHFYFDNKANNMRFKRNFPVVMDREQLVTYDGYMQDRFDLYAPRGYVIDSLVVGAPDVLDAIDRLNMGADVEILGSQLYMIFPGMIDVSSQLETLINSGHELSVAFADNLSRYKDERAISKIEPIGHGGKWLIRKR